MSENPSSSSNCANICSLCNESTAKYCCPRCEAYYCSVTCYKSEKHAECSESFYQECVTEELASGSNDEETTRKMMEILKRMRENDDLDNLEDASVDSDDPEGEDLHDRIKGINLDDADAVWDALTEDERNEFQALIQQGDVGSILPQWEPWWSYTKDARLVQEFGNSEEEEALMKCPEIIEVPELSTLTSVQPSPAICYNITNVLAAYAFVMRYFNGELDPVEGATYFLDICANLDSNTNFDDAATAVESVKQKCLQSTLIKTDEASLQVMKRDTFFLLQGPSEENKLQYCMSALSHLQTILEEARLEYKTLEKYAKQPKLEPKKLPKIEKAKLPNAEVQKTTENRNVFSKKFPDNKGDYLPKLDTSKLKKCMKKVVFYMSFVESCGLDFE